MAYSDYDPGIFQLNLFIPHKMAVVVIFDC